jgi:hypothetical protein
MTYGANESLADLQKSVREQKILLSALQDHAPASSMDDIDSLKKRIATVDKQIHSGGSRLNSSKPELLLSRYSSRMRQLSDLADHQRSMRKEIEFTLNTTIKDLEKQILRETEILDQKEQELARIRDVKGSGSTTYNASMSDADRIRSKAQAMIAARLNKTTYVESTSAESKKVELAIGERERQLQKKLAKVDDVRVDLRRVLESAINGSDIEQNERQLKEQRMFEDGLFVSEELSDFVESLRRDRAQKAAAGDHIGNGTSRYGPPPATPPLPRQYLPAPPPLPSPLPSRPSLGPPPVPTSLRPQTPRSAEAIKAEAHRRIDEKRMSLQSPLVVAPISDESQLLNDDDAQYKVQLQEAEKAAQAKLREAERQAQIRLSEFNQRKKEAEASKLAAEEEDRKQKQEAEKKVLKEEEERLERERMELEKKKKAEEEQRQIQEQLEKERQRIEHEKLQIEREEQEARERQRRLEEETRAAEKAREEEAERLRRAQEELDRAMKAEEEKRREAEAVEKEQQRLLELERARLAAIEEERKKKEAEEEERKRQELEIQAKEEGIWSTDLHNEARRTRNSMDFRHATNFPTSFSFANEPRTTKGSESESESEFEFESESESGPEQAETNATAGTAGFGTDLDDEVDFSTSKLKGARHGMAGHGRSGQYKA